MTGERSYQAAQFNIKQMHVEQVTESFPGPGQFESPLIERSLL